MLNSVCVICGESGFKKLFTKGGRDFLRCHRCGLIRLDPMPSFEKLEQYYDREYEVETGMGTALAAEEEMARLTAQYRLGIVRRYSSGRRLLDVGCATGVFLEEVSKAGLNGEGIDVSKKAVEQARNKRIKAFAGTLENFVPEGPCDIVTGFDVIEHVLDPVAFLESIARLLLPGGILALTTPDTNSWSCRLMRQRWYFYIPEQHLFYFNQSNLSSLLRRLGFTVLNISKARKALNYNYSLLQFQAYNPLIFRSLNPISRVTPQSWRQYAFKLCIGEMIVVAQKPT